MVCCKIVLLLNKSIRYSEINKLDLLLYSLINWLSISKSDGKPGLLKKERKIVFFSERFMKTYNYQIFLQFVLYMFWQSLWLAWGINLNSNPEFWLAVRNLEEILKRNWIKWICIWINHFENKLPSKANEKRIIITRIDISIW